LGHTRVQRLPLTEVKQYAAVSTQPFTDSHDGSFAGKHSFIDASEKASLCNVFAFAVEYSKMPDTSACILVPDWSSARFNHYLKGSQLLKVYAGGILQPYPVKLVYMPAKSAHMSEALVSGQQCAMCFDGSLAGYPARIAADSQASHTFFDQGWVNRAGLAVTPASMKVLLADGKTEVKVVGSCTARMQVGALHDRVTRLVLQSLNQCHDVILGDDYLAAWKCVLNYGTRSMSVRKGQRSITIKVPPPAEPNSTNTDASAVAPSAAVASPIPHMLSAVQAKSALKKVPDEAFVVVVRARSLVVILCLAGRMKGLVVASKRMLLMPPLLPMWGTALAASVACLPCYGGTCICLQLSCMVCQWVGLTCLWCIPYHCCQAPCLLHPGCTDCHPRNVQRWKRWCLHC